MQKRNLRLGRFLWGGCAVILFLIPFHAFLTAWFASRFGSFDLIRLWKEAVLLVLAAVSVVTVVRHPSVRKELKSNRIVQLSLLFIGFICLMTIIGLVTGNVGWKAALYGFIIDVRSFVFLLVMMVAACLAPLPRTRRRWLLIPAVIVILFGLLQLFVLPADFLRHFGYSPSTLPAFQPVDNKPELARLQSTLRGPNPLGAYLVPILLSVLTLGLTIKKRRPAAALLFVLGLLVLVMTYSRSALLGLLVSMVIFGLLAVPRTKTRRMLLLGVATAAVLFGGVFFVMRDNDQFQNYFFHTNEKSTSSVSSNSARFSALRGGVKDVIHEPLGRGVGSAGPASQRNTKQTPRIAENYFVQLAQEAGVIGLALYIGAMTVIGAQLWKRREDRLAAGAFAALVGVALINMLSHAWADDTLAYTSFALLGFVIVKTSTKSENLAKLERKR